MVADTGDTIALVLGDRGFQARGVGSESGLSQDVEGLLYHRKQPLR